MLGQKSEKLFLKHAIASEKAFFSRVLETSDAQFVQSMFALFWKHEITAAKALFFFVFWDIEPTLAELFWSGQQNDRHIFKWSIKPINTFWSDHQNDRYFLKWSVRNFRLISKFALFHWSAVVNTFKTENEFSLLQ